MIDSLYFLIFYFFLYLIGRGFFLLFLIFNNKNVAKFQLNQYSHFFSIIGLFVIGELKLIFNFFSNTNFFLILVILIGFYGNKYFLSLKAEKIQIQALIAFILGISSNTVNFSYDAGLYHLNAQGWMNESKIVFGLTNLHSRYGFSSFIEYINSTTWVFNNFIFQHFTNLIFIVSFFIFLYNCLSNPIFINYKISALTILLFGVLDNFGVNGGRNGFIVIEAVSKQDTPFAVVFFFLLVYVLFYFYNSNEESGINFFIILFLFLFSVQLRIFALSLTPLIIFIFIRELFIFKKSYKYKLSVLILILLGIFWSFKNFIISSCLFYPIAFTCIQNTSWFNKNNAILDTSVISNFHIAFDPRDQNLIDWFNLWSQTPINNTVFLNFVYSLALIFIFTLIVTKKRETKTYPKVFMMPIYLFSIWIISSPGIRMGLSISLISIFCIGINRSSLNNFFDKKYLINLLFLASLLLLPRISDYKEGLSNPFQFTQLIPPTIEYYDQSNTVYWGVRPSLGDKCWINLNCVPGPVVIDEDLVFNYRVFNKINK